MRLRRVRFSSYPRTDPPTVYVRILERAPREPVAPETGRLGGSSTALARVATLPVRLPRSARSFGMGEGLVRYQVRALIGVRLKAGHATLTR